MTNIRHWLNSGFHEWGPSWDLWDPTGKEQLLFGQIGDPDGDEVDSLHVIVAPKTAIHLKEQMALDLAIGVTVRGTLYNDSHTESTISDNAKAALGKARSREELKRMSYYLVVHDVEPDGRRTVDYIDKTKDQPQIYSAYMWQCLIRKSDAAKGRPGEIDLPRTIFTWEHTNLLNRDCIAFNFRSLEWKKSYLERLGQPLDVLQHSYSVERVLGISLTQPLLDQRRLAGILRTPHDSV